MKFVRLPTPPPTSPSLSPFTLPSGTVTFLYTDIEDSTGLALYHETIQAWQDLCHRGAVAHQLECFTSIAAVQWDTGMAVQLLGAADALRENIVAPMTPLERGGYDLLISSLRARIDETSFAEAWAQGRAMGMEEAVALALEAIHAP